MLAKGLSLGRPDPARDDRGPPDYILENGMTRDRAPVAASYKAVMALTRAGMMHRDRISLDELFCPIIMAEETQCYGDGTLFCYGFDTTSYYDDGTSASHDSGVSDVEDFSELSLDMLERHGKYWDAQSIGDWNAQSINYARYGRALGVTALHDYVCVCIAGATVPSRIFQDLSEYRCCQTIL
ncbi:hypothetical protein CABS02_13367 [Colletotrichum abscissum]|uniref:Uncharacterized protein n=1 Tax=Colletotrichum abscissum TaxID=1671311 RepID=A0A9P9X385_9PEZI|nr:hypothetical protein CABS02_13367 [Colletotrichum abscissum]